MNITKNMDHRIPIFKQMEEERRPVNRRKKDYGRKPVKRKYVVSHALMDGNGCFGLLTCPLTMYKKHI